MTKHEPLIKAIEAYLSKADDDLSGQLEDEGYLHPNETVEAINTLEESVAGILTEQTKRVITATKKAVDLEEFAKKMWPKFKLSDKTADKLAKIFRTTFEEMMPKFADYYMKQLDAGLKVTRLSQRTTAWIENWSAELADIMQLNSHQEVEAILTSGLQDGIGIAEFSRNLLDSGVRDEYYKARRVAVTEVLTAHRASQWEASMQNPSTSVKVWRHTGIYIHAPRENHKDMDGTTVPKGEPFTIVGEDGGYYQAMFPGDPSLPPGERINCHCIVEYPPDEDVLGLSLEERKRLQQEALDELDDAWFEEQENRSKAAVGFTD